MALMAGDFQQRTERLLERVGGGSITGRVVVDQVYAQYQHEGLDLKHPGGGEAKFLERPLHDGADKWVRDVAETTLREGPQRAMRDATERVARGVFERAPFEFGDLKASPHPTVKDGGRIVYDRPPAMRRLTERELRVKGRLRSLGLGNER